MATKTAQKTGDIVGSAAGATATLAKQQEHSLKAPEWLTAPEPGERPQGLDEMTQQDVTLPRLGLCQSLSPQRKRTDPKFIEGLQEGDFFNSITGESYGPKVKIVPLLFYKQQWLFEEGALGKVLCFSLDAINGTGDPGGPCDTCSLNQFGADGKPPACYKFFNYACLVVGKDEQVRPDSIAVFALKSTGLKIAKDWNALIRLRNRDIFSGVYELSSMEQRKDTYSWFAPVIKNAGWVSQDAYRNAVMAYAGVSALRKEGRLKHDVSDMGGMGDDREQAPTA